MAARESAAFDFLWDGVLDDDDETSDTDDDGDMQVGTSTATEAPATSTTIDKSVPKSATTMDSGYLDFDEQEDHLEAMIAAAAAAAIKHGSPKSSAHGPAYLDRATRRYR